MATSLALKTLIKKAKSLIEDRQYEKAIILLNDKVLEKHKSPELYFLRAKSHSYLGQTQELLSYAEKSVALDSKYSPGYLAMGLARERLREFDKALQDYNTADKFNPNNEVIITNRANIFAIKGDLANAMTDYIRAIEIKPKYASPHNGKAILLKKSAKYLEALEEVELAIKYAPLNDKYHRNLGDIYFELAKYKEALVAYEKAVELSPENIYYQTLRDKVKAKLGKPVSSTVDNQSETTNTASNIEKLLAELNENDKKVIRPAWVDVEEVIKKIRELLLYTGKDSIVHYTRINTGDILAMNPDFKLRYSNVVFMNDPEEGDIFLDYIGERSFTDSFNRAEKFDENNIYLGSFLPSDKKDYLNMWRTYGKNDQNEEATGCSFLIRPNFFDSEDGGSMYNDVDQSHSQPLYWVVYFDKSTNALAQDNQVDKVKLTQEIANFKLKLNALLDLRNPGDIHNRDFKNKKIDQLVYRFVSELRYFFKSAEYQFEKELRVIKYYPAESQKVIVDSNSALLPRKLYIESTQKLQPFVSEITLGPKVIHPERYLYIEALFKKGGHEIQLKRSICSYQ